MADSGRIRAISSSASVLSQLDQKRADEMASGWYLSDRGREAVAVALALRKTKHALYAHAPMVCQGEDSPCAPTCELAISGMAPTGERCPLEIVSLVEFFNNYCEDLDIDMNNMVDLGLVRELAEVEIQLDRVSKRLAQEDWVTEVNTGVDSQGRVIRRPEIHKAFEIQEKLRARKDKILDQLNATRKAKSKMELWDELDPSQRAAQLLARARIMAEEEKQEGMVVDAEIVGDGPEDVVSDLANIDISEQEA